jgi:hypothetical protein
MIHIGLVYAFQAKTYMFSTTVVPNTERPTRKVVKSRYLPNNGMAREVEGIISDMRRKNIVCERRIVMQSAIFSLELAGK